MAAVDVRRIKLWQDRIDTEVEIAGEGPPLVYLHGPWGLAPDRAFVARLAERHQVFAPKFPGTSAGDPNSVHALDGWHDLVVYTGELFDRLGLSSPALVGHSFGALLAAEFAAAVPHAVGRLVLIDPVGLWRDDHPVKNWMILSDAVRRASLFAAPDGEAARRFFDVPADAGGARRRALAIHLGAGLHRQIRLAGRRPRLGPAHPSHRRADFDSLGRCRWHRRSGLCARICPAHSPAQRSRSSMEPAICRNSNSRNGWSRRLGSFWPEL